MVFTSWDIFTNSYIFSKIDTQSGTMIDIGANVGNHSVFLSKFFRQIIAFEPHPRNFLLLQANGMLTENILPINTALGSSTGSANLSYSDEIWVQDPLPMM
jgi:FkbM family methyltransferase